jgi:transcription termination factor Rho
LLLSSREHTKSPIETDSLPFGAMERPKAGGDGHRNERHSSQRHHDRREQGGRDQGGGDPRPRRERGLSPVAEPGRRNGSEEPREQASSATAQHGGGDPGLAPGREKRDWRKPHKRRGGSRRGGRRRRKNKGGVEGQPADGAVAVAPPPAPQAPQAPHVPHAPQARPEGEGMFVLEKGNFGTLRRREAMYLPSKQDIFVAQRLVQVHKLRDGAIVRGHIAKGKKHKYQLLDVITVDDRQPRDVANLPVFKNLRTIDPDFHYAIGDVTKDVSMRVVDLLAPVGRGQRGLIVAAPRTGKTTLLRKFATGIEQGYPDVRLLVLLVDERPEEATDWQRSTKGEVFVSTSDESPKNHVQLAEAVWKRCQRLVELGEEVVLILDSITRLARAFNNFSAGSGRTMSGGLDSRAMERPRQIFGSARNTEDAGSLTILGTTLVDTGSRMDQLIFEEFKGTGNMELVLSRKLADRRIFPAIDVEKSGTRKEEKLLSAKRLKRINTLRRVLLRMNFIEAMELLVDKLENVDMNDEFLQRFDVDPEA